MSIWLASLSLKISFFLCDIQWIEAAFVAKCKKYVLN